MKAKKVRHVAALASKIVGKVIKNRKPKPSTRDAFDSLDAPTLELRARKIINEHFDKAEQRLPGFLDEHYRSFGDVMWRNVRGVTNPLVQGRNAVSWIWTKFGGRDFSTTTWTEDTLRRLFVEELVQLGALERALSTVHMEIGNAVDQQLQVLRESPKLAGKSPEQVEAMILDYLGTTNGLSAQLEKAVTVGAFAVASYLVIGEIQKSLVPVGAAVAGSIYIAQAGFFAGLWYSVFSVPVWVEALGMAAGAGIAVLVAPVIAGVIQWGLNHRQVFEQEMRNRLNSVRTTLLDGKATDTGTTVESVIVGILRQRDLAADFVALVTRAVRAA